MLPTISNYLTLSPQGNTLLKEKWHSGNLQSNFLFLSTFASVLVSVLVGDSLMIHSGNASLSPSIHYRQRLVRRQKKGMLLPVYALCYWPNGEAHHWLVIRALIKRGSLCLSVWAKMDDFCFQGGSSKQGFFFHSASSAYKGYFFSSLWKALMSASRTRYHCNWRENQRLFLCAGSLPHLREQQQKIGDSDSRIQSAKPHPELINPKGGESRLGC